MKNIIQRIKNFIEWCTTGVWEDPRANLGIRLVKTCNLAARSFLDRGLQIKSMSLTYSTVLAIVPAFAMLLAIGRGFGMQDLMESSIYTYFPSQSKAIATFMQFVDSYLKEASQGLFVGIGIVFLLWTVVSLLSSIEDAFNNIWDVRHDRNFYQKITDYIAICLIIPVLIICSSGLSIFMATIVQDKVHIPFLTPVLNAALEMTPLLLVWLAFSLSFWLIPNIKVTFKYAAISGGLCAISFQILQLLFVSGQIYVSKYNAIYGSFAFLPLLLIWLQLSWLILLSGCVLTYALQNIFTFDFLGNEGHISQRYLHKMEIIVMAVIADHFVNHKQPPTIVEISTGYDIPIRIATSIEQRLIAAGLVYSVVNGDDDDVRNTRLTPAVEPGELTVSLLLDKLNNEGRHDFIPRFEAIYGNRLKQVDEILADAYPMGKDVKLTDLTLPTPQELNPN